MGAIRRQKNKHKSKQGANLQGALLAGHGETRRWTDNGRLTVSLKTV